jgi:hypothetical protein
MSVLPLSTLNYNPPSIDKVLVRRRIVEGSTDGLVLPELATNCDRTLRRQEVSRRSLHNGEKGGNSRQEEHHFKFSWAGGEFEYAALGLTYKRGSSF